MTSHELLNSGRRYVYYLNKTSPDPQNKDRFRVSLVFEDNAGHYPTGTASEHQSPWYWDEETCKKKNKNMGYDEEETFKIVASSMFCDGNGSFLCGRK